MAVTLTTSWQTVASATWNFSGATIYNIYLDAKYSTQDTVNNRTTVQTRLRTQLQTGYGSGNGYNFTCSYAPTVSGSGLWYLDTETITSGESVISHNSDGTKSLNLTGSASISGLGKSSNLSATVNLPTIPRASKINSITNSISNDGNTVKVNVNFTKYASSFYQQLVLMNVGRTETIATFNGVSSGTDYYLDATARQKLYNWIGTSLDNKGVICDLKTYTSSAMTTSVGTYSDVTYYKLPTYSLSFTTSSVVDSITTYDTYKPNTNTFIANLSKPKYTFSASSSTGSTYGRSIGYKIGSTSVTSPYTNNNYTGQSLTITASDGRKSVNSTPSMTHVAYFTPTLTTKVVRPTPTGSAATVNVSGKLYKGTGLTNLLTPTLKFKYTESGGTEQEITIPLTLTDSGDTTSFTGTATLSGLNYKRTVSWNATLTDRINISVSNSDTLVEGLPLWNGYKKNDKNYFNVNGNVVADTYNSFILDTGTNNTNDTWVPVFNGNKIQHRVINSALNNRGVTHLTSKTYVPYSNTNLVTVDTMAFWNGAYNSSNASNLTYAHQGTIQCKPTSLFNNTSGNNGTITLSQTSANFTYLEIFFALRSTNVNYFTSVRVYSPNGKVVSLASFVPQSNVEVLGLGKYTISGTSVTRNYVGSYVSFGSPAATNEIYIYHVDGYK